MPQARTAKKRRAMVERQLAARGIGDPRVLDAMGEIPREEFVPDHLRPFAYDDSALPIEAGQTISQPYIVAHMAELAEIRPDDTVLEIGAGSGYAAAILGQLARHVFAIERHHVLADKARQRMTALGYENVKIIHGDGYKGWPPVAPFDAIIVSAGAEEIPPALKSQLKVGGRLILPLRQGPDQVLMRIQRTGADTFKEEWHGLVAFVPLIGSDGSL